jgi:hypothetical protein
MQIRTSQPRPAAGLTDVDLAALRYWVPAGQQVGGVPVWLSRTGFSGELGFQVFLRPEHALALREAIGTPAHAVRDGCDRSRSGSSRDVVTATTTSRTTLAFDALGPVRPVPRADDGHRALRTIAEDPPNRFVTIRLDEEAPTTVHDAHPDGAPRHVLASARSSDRSAWRSCRPRWPPPEPPSRRLPPTARSPVPSTCYPSMTPRKSVRAVDRAAGRSTA